MGMIDVPREVNGGHGSGSIGEDSSSSYIERLARYVLKSKCVFDGNKISFYASQHFIVGFLLSLALFEDMSDGGFCGDSFRMNMQILVGDFVFVFVVYVIEGRASLGGIEEGSRCRPWQREQHLWPPLACDLERLGIAEFR